MQQVLLVQGEAVVQVLQGNDSLLDSRLLSLTIAESSTGSATVHMHFQCRPSSQFCEVELTFEEAQEFGFYYTHGYSLAYVTAIKLSRSPEGLFYISLDPTDESECPSEEDQDFVLAKQLVARCHQP